MESRATTALGPFHGVAIDTQRAACRAWLDDGNRPEVHFAVREHSVSPPPAGDFDILSRLWVSNQWADKSKIHCNLCNTRSKFVSGGYLAAYDDGWWYVVGPDCGGEEFFGKFNTAKHRYERSEAELAAEGGLRQLLTGLGRWRVFHSQVGVASQAAEKAAQWLESAEPDLFRRLQDVRRGEGRLMLATRERAYDRHGKPFTRDSEKFFATLSGAKGVSRPCISAAYFKRVSGDVLGYLDGRKSLLDAITSCRESGELKTLQTSVETALDNLRHAHENLLEARQFWEPSNLDWLSAWIAQSGSRFERKFALRSQGDIVTIEWEDDPDYRPKFDVSEIRAYIGSVPPTQ